MKKRIDTVSEKIKTKLPLVFDLAIVLICCIIIFNHFDKTMMFSNNVPIGSDIIYHYANVKILHDNILPEMVGWNMYTGSGSPFTTYYPPFMYYIIALIGLILPLAPTFNVMMVFGSVLLPLAVYSSLRFLNISRPGPVIGSLLSLLMLLHNDSYAFGGNVKSVISGEFAHACAIMLFTVYVGLLWKGVQEKRYLILNSILLGLISMTHPIAFIAALPLSIYFIVENKQNLKYCMYHYGLSFLLTGAWFFRMVLYNNYLQIYHGLIGGSNKVINSGWASQAINTIIPSLVMPLFIVTITIIVITAACNYLKPQKIPSQVIYIAWTLSIQIALFTFNITGWLDRFLPHIYVCLVLCIGVSIGIFLNPETIKKKNVITSMRQLLNKNVTIIVIAIIIALLVILSPLALYKNYKGSSKYLFQGHEKNGQWENVEPLIKYIGENITDDDRIVSTTIQAESLYLYNEKKSTTALFTYSSSAKQGNYFKNIKVVSNTSTIDPHNLAEKCRLFNVRWIIADKNQTEKINTSDEYILHAIIGNKYIFEVNSSQYGYVIPLRYKPIAIISKKENANTDITQGWFLSYSSENRFFTYITTATEKEKNRFLFNTTKTKTSNISAEYLPCNATATVYSQKINIITDCINQPVLVKISHFARWKVIGADKIYVTGPSFMLIYPQQKEVTLYYGKTWIDYVGYLMLLTGIVIIIASLCFTNSFSKIDVRIESLIKKNIKYIPQIPNGIVNVSIIIIAIVLLLHVPNVHYRIQEDLIQKYNYEKGIYFFNHEKYNVSLPLFEKIISSKKSTTNVNAQYYASISAYHLKKYSVMKKYGLQFISASNNSEMIGSFRYHYAKSLAEVNDTKAFLQEVQILQTQYNNTQWQAQIDDYFTEWKKTHKYNEEEMK